MPDEQEVSRAINELQAISEQKKEILVEFGKKYAKLEAEIKELENKKKTISEAIQPISDVREEGLVIIKQAKFQESEIIRGAEAEKKQLLDQARAEAKKIIDSANNVKAEYEAILAGINAKVDGAAASERKANEYLRNAEKMLLDAEFNSAEASKAQEKAIREQSKASELITVADIKLKALDAFQSELAEMDKAVKKDKEDLQNYRVLVDDMQKNLNLNISLFEEEKKRIYVEIDTEKALLTSRLAVVKEQEETNAWRSRELDIGYELLKNKQAALDRDIKRLEGLKKELSK